jgi:SAM-dependent methyltransferase
VHDHSPLVIVRLMRAMNDLPSADHRAKHWADVYKDSNPDALSWYQPEPAVSLELVEVLGVEPESAVLDVGGGASGLVDRLLARGFTDLTVLDISDAALRAGRQRVGDDPRVAWITGDLLSWEPTRHYALWHDRAVLHFLSRHEVVTYRNVVRRAVAPGGSVIIATFAPDGPERCSGLPVTRYSADELGAVLGSGFQVVEHRREIHTTPAGSVQPFTWIAARRSS